MKKIIFICIENACRSQMAEAFATTHGKKKIKAYSAGTKPIGIVNAKAIESMNMKGFDLTMHKSKSIKEFNDMIFDYAISMGCGDECSIINASNYEDWQIPDPKNLTLKDFNIIRDLIELKIKQLISTL